MATLTITGSGAQDHSGDVLSNIDVIEFDTSGFTFAFFSPAQFDDVQISQAVNITGDANSNFFFVSGVAGIFSAAAWTFSNWSNLDFIEIGGSAGNDIINGSSVADSLLGFEGNDTLIGGDGDDQLVGYGGNDLMIGGDGNDILNDGDGNDLLFGLAGNDTVFYGSAGAGVTVILTIVEAQNTIGAGNDTLIGIENLTGSSFGDTLTGNPLANVLSGIFGNDTLSGLGGNDTLLGGAGVDILTGGGGRDLLTGGTERDLFDFNSVKDSVKGANRDQILDFLRGTDDIDLRTIDAKTGIAGNQAFKFIGKQGFHDQKGELRYIDKGATVIVQGDVNGDGKADFEIFVAVNSLGKGDFLL